MVNWKEYGILFEDFTETISYEWLGKGVAMFECKEWLEAGVKADESSFCKWLQDKRKFTAEHVKNCENVEELRKEYEKQVDNYYYGQCQVCKQPNAYFNWCKNSSQHYQDYSNWTSGNPGVDKFILKCQIEATSASGLLARIPYNDFTEVEYLATGGFGKVYKAKLVSGESEGVMALKILNNSQNITADLLQEITKHRLVFDMVVKCIGISQDPVTKNYIMVMEYMNEGNLRQSLKDNQARFYDKYLQLYGIIGGLHSIHKQDLVHRDLHPGNILKRAVPFEGSDEIVPTFLITDLGLCRPVNETNDEEVYGVLPYVAPEVLHGKPYTQASDIYSLGIIMYEVLSGLPPYTVYDEKANRYKERPYNTDLSLAIINGLRPVLDNVTAPQLFKDLISRCWDADAAKRPTASELEKVYIDINNTPNLKDTEFGQQLKEIKRAEELDALSPLILDCQTHPQEVYTSKLLSTKEIFQRLQIGDDKSNNKQSTSNPDSLLIIDELQFHQEIPPK